MNDLNDNKFLMKCQNAEFYTESGKLVKGLDIEIKKGECIYILSSEDGLEDQVLLFLAGFINPARGEISYGKNNFKRDICFVKNDMEYPLSVLDVIVGSERGGLFDFSKKKQVNAKAREMLAKTNMQDAEKRKFSELSTGEKRRVLIAKALFSSADTVFLECPTSGLDILSAKKINSLLKSCGKTVICSELDINNALEWADKILVCSYDDFFFGTPQEFIELYC